MPTLNSIAVVGAGITGITTAYSLLNRGYTVTVYDRDRYAAMQTSFANGGQISASNAEVWNQMSTVLKGIKWMFKKDAPLLVNPKPSWHKLSWMAEFVSNIPTYEKNTIETVTMAVAAREHLFAWAEKENIDFDLETRGIMHIYKNQKDFDHATHVNKLLTRGGLERNALTPEEMKEIEPALTGNFVGGYLTPSDSTGDIHKFTRGLAEACVRLGAEFVYDAQVEQLEHDKEGVNVHFRPSAGRTAPLVPVVEGRELMERRSHSAVVVCAGTQSREFASQLGDRVNIYPIKGYSVTLPLKDEESQSVAPWVSILDDDAKVVSSRLGADRLRIAGTAEFNGFNLDIRSDRIDPLVSWCRTFFPGIDTEHVVAWAGLRPMMPDMLPRVGAGKHKGVFYNTGHGHLGWTLAPTTAELVADVIKAALPQNTNA